MSAQHAAPAAIELHPWSEQPTVLDALGPAARARLDGIASRLDVPAGAIILRDGAVTPFLGLVEHGRIGLRLAVPDRGTRTVVTIEPGELVGWSAVVPPYRATAEAVALEDTRIQAFEAVVLRALLASDRDIAAELLPAVLACVSDRLTTSWQQLLDLFGTGPVQPW